MKLSSRVNYGIKFLMDIAINGEKNRVYLDETAGRNGVSEEYILILLENLKEKGVITIENNGKRKICRLNIEPENISVADLIKMFEEHFFYFEIERNESYSGRIDCIIEESIWNRMETIIRENFKEMTLKTLIESYREAYSYMMYI